MRIKIKNKKKTTNLWLWFFWDKDLDSSSTQILLDGRRRWRRCCCCCCLLNRLKLRLLLWQQTRRWKQRLQLDEEKNDSDGCCLDDLDSVARGSGVGRDGAGGRLDREELEVVRPVERSGRVVVEFWSLNWRRAAPSGRPGDGGCRVRGVDGRVAFAAAPAALRLLLFIDELELECLL